MPNHRAIPHRIRAACRALTWAGTALLIVPITARAQVAEAADPTETRVVVSKSIAVDPDGGALRLEFSQGPDLSIELVDGEVRVDGETVGSYRSDAPLVTTWKGLLERAAQLENGELRRLLIDWAPSDDAGEAPGTLEQRVDEALERALANAGEPGPPLQIHVVQTNEGETQQIEVRARAVQDSEARAGGDSLDRPIVIDMRSEIAERLRSDLRSEIEEQIRREMRRDSRSQGVIGRVFGGLGGALAQLLTVAVLSLFGAIAYHFAGPNLETVARTARRNPTRSLIVGLAGSFLLLPAYVLGIVALVLTIIGIPALLLWVPLFPVVVVLAMGLGYLAVARNLGTWVARQDLPLRGWVRETNPVTLIFGGALVLGTGFIAAELVSVLPFTSALELLLVVAASLLSTVVTLIGFGAVIQTRVGTRPSRFDGFDPEDDFDLDWRSRSRHDPADEDGPRGDTSAPVEGEPQ